MHDKLNLCSKVAHPGHQAAFSKHKDDGDKRDYVPSTIYGHEDFPADPVPVNNLPPPSLSLNSELKRLQRPQKVA